jgi:SH3 domain-containing protein
MILPMSTRAIITLKRLLLTGVAALLMATSAHADVSLSPTDPLIGGWCETNNSKLLKRGSCSSLVVEQSGYSGEENSCMFLEIKRIRNGIEAYSECSAESLVQNYYFETTVFQIVDKRLKVQDLTTYPAKKQKETSCVSVLPTPDGYLNLREGPGMEFKVKAKLTIGEYLKIDASSGEWIHTINAVERQSAAGIVSGWVYSKYVKEIESCHVP